VAKFATCTAGVIDTGDKFATNVNNTGGKLPQVSTTPCGKFATSGINGTGGI
jgi:hypothetical protein